MSQSEIKKILNKFLASAKKETGKNPSYKELYSYVKEYSKDFPIKKPEKSVRKKSIRKNTTEPGGEFDASLCHCRVWNKGLAKQCSNKPKENNMCGTHMNAVEKNGGWSLGLYCEEIPRNHLFGCGQRKAGDQIPWKDIRKSSSKKNYNSKKVIDPMVEEWKDKYEQKFGGRPRGPKASNIEWIRSKLESSSEEESESSDSDNEDNSFKNEDNSDDDDEAKNDDDESKNDDDDESKNDDDDEAKNDDDESKNDNDDDESKNDDDDEAKNDDESKNDDDDIPDGLKKIKYEGVTYFKSIEKDGKYEITNEDDIVGYMDDDDIIEFEEGYDEIHQDHEDYNP